MLLAHVSVLSSLITSGYNCMVRFVSTCDNSYIRNATNHDLNCSVESGMVLQFSFNNQAVVDIFISGY